jgi:hypothetical protein
MIPPTFVVDTRYDTRDIARRPVSVTIRPIRTGGTNASIPQVIMAIGNKLQTEVLRVINRYNFWTRQQSLDRVIGLLQMQNIGDARHMQTKNVLLADLNEDNCIEIFEIATGSGSNPDLDVYETEWMYYINPNSLGVGAAKEWTNDENYKGLSPYIWKDSDVGCGIVEWTNGFIRKTKPAWLKHGFQKGKNAALFKEMCRSTNRIFGDGQRTMTTFQLTQIVDLPEYLEWRIVILYVKTSNMNMFRRGHNYELNNDPKLDKTIYIYHDVTRSHFVYVTSPKEFLRSGWNNSVRLFCHKCITSYTHQTNCRCGTITAIPKIAVRKQCSDCNEVYTGDQHVCHHYKCKHCVSYHKRDDYKSRCTLFKDDDTFVKRFDFEEEDITMEDAIDGSAFEKTKSWGLLVYDLESALVIVKDEEKDEFEVDEHGNYVYEDGEIVTFRVSKELQCPNFAVVMDAGTEEMWTFTSLSEMITFCLHHNDGRNICLAHNASGYDSRLVFEEASKNTDIDISTTMNGGRIMTMTIGKTKFQDTMLHLKGSLKKLAEGFKLDLKKGHFPHLFNKAVNYDYVGPIPEKKHFDLSSFGSQSDMNAFHKWHDEWEGDWNFKEELER